MSNPGARIDRVHNSWRVRVPGMHARYFPFRKHGGKEAALQEATAFRDRHWDGESYREKMRLRNAAIAKLAKNGWTQKRIAKAYGISPQRVSQILKDSERGEG